MKITLIILRILTGFVFIFSAYVKLFPIELIEVAMVETGFISWSLAPFAARILVGFELFLGLMLVTGLYEKFFLKVSIIILVMFTVYLLFLLIFQGNNTNCNCFGLFLAMTPVESIVKNIILMLILFLVLLKKRSMKTLRLRLAFTLITGLVSLILVFVFAPVIIATNRFSSEELNYRLNLELIYNDPDAEQPEMNLEKGKYIVLFLSSSCPHCTVAGYKFHVLKQKHKDLPVFFFINGDEEDIRDFHFKTKSSDIPYAHIKAGTLIMLAGSQLPVVYWIEDGIVIRKNGYFDINEKEMTDWAEN